MHYDNDEVRLPEWALSHAKDAVSTARLPAPGNEEINPVESPCIENCELFWSVQDADDAIVGFIGISQIDWKSRHAEMFVSGSLASSEHVKVAIMKMIDHCMNPLNLNRVHTRVSSDNALCRMLDELGFAREATLANHAWIDGDYRDVIWFGLLKTDGNGGQV